MRPIEVSEKLYAHHDVHKSGSHVWGRPGPADDNKLIKRRRVRTLLQMQSQISNNLRADPEPCLE